VQRDGLTYPVHVWKDAQAGLMRTDTYGGVNQLYLLKVPTDCSSCAPRQLLLGAHTAAMFRGSEAEAMLAPAARTVCSGVQSSCHPLFLCIPFWWVGATLDGDCCTCRKAHTVACLCNSLLGKWLSYPHLLPLMKGSKGGRVLPQLFTEG